ncbi:hypothetical protein [Curtobacterium sp. SORGH_AS_0776]|uniref:hypothetical protein n=1 Tax=Curtobacterium sp. SORGH_AS_0776 TaxID=3041798 RepID=UPI0028619342|nr:hypothetical protein [Curtobacterium sp. SORGH_AS_0776]MDR6172637.1 hypothetical protein [Curtobacterium sp. SORGH_AS_0776]
MTSIKIIKAVGGKKEGETYDVSPGAADYLINTGYAEEVENTARRGRPKKTTDSSDSDKGGGVSSKESGSTAG